MLEQNPPEALSDQEEGSPELWGCWKGLVSFEAVPREALLGISFCAAFIHPSQHPSASCTCSSAIAHAFFSKLPLRVPCLVSWWHPLASLHFTHVFLVLLIFCVHPGQKSLFCSSLSLAAISPGLGCR